MAPKALVSLFLATMASLVQSAALPAEATTVYPEVIPGPGLPSLASLGLTSADLYNRTIEDNRTRPHHFPRHKHIANIIPHPAPFPLSAGILERRFDPGCGPSESAYTSVSNIIACYNFLRSIGGNACVVNGQAGSRSTFCSAGDGKISGTNIRNGPVSSSWYGLFLWPHHREKQTYHVKGLLY